MCVCPLKITLHYYIKWIYPIAIKFWKVVEYSPGKEGCWASTSIPSPRGGKGCIGV